MITKIGEFDGPGFFLALDASRQDQAITWRKVAELSGVSQSTLTRMSQGKRPDVDSLAALTTWSGLSVDDFVKRNSEEVNRSPKTLAQITIYLRSDPNLSEEAATALNEVIQATYKRLKMTSRE